MPRRDFSLGHARAAEPPGPGRSWAGVGAESRRCRCGSWRSLDLGGQARDGRESCSLRVGLLNNERGPDRRTGPARGAGAPHARRWGVHASQLRGRRLSRPALDRPGPGRRERSDRRTRRVGVVSTRVTMRNHDGIDIPSPPARSPVSVCPGPRRRGGVCAMRQARCLARAPEAAAVITAIVGGSR